MEAAAPERNWHHFCLKSTRAGRPGAARGQDELGFSRELLDRFCDRVPLIRDDPPDDLVAIAAQELVEEIAARVLAPTHVDTVGDGQDGRLHARCFVFSTSRTSPSSIPSSTAFAMS